MKHIKRYNEEVDLKKAVGTAALAASLAGSGLSQGFTNKDFSDINVVHNIRHGEQSVLFDKLISIDIIDKPTLDSMTVKQKRKIIDCINCIPGNISNKIDTLKIFNKVKSPDLENFYQVNKLFDKVKVGTSYEEKTLMNFIENIQDPNGLVSAHMFLINIPIPTGDVLYNVPLYGIKIKPNSKTELIFRSTLHKDISIEGDISDKLKVIFMTNPTYTSFGIRIKNSFY